MEFDELQKIWDAQSNQPLYAINEKALHNRVQSKMNRARLAANVSEILLMIINLGTGSFIFRINFLKKPANIFLYVLAAWMFGTFVYILVSRVRRIKGDRRFDRSIRGDLQYAISLAAYQVRLSQLMRWNNLVLFAFILLSAVEGGKLFWTSVVVLISFTLAWFVGKWEDRINKNRKRELEILEEKLEEKG